MPLSKVWRPQASVVYQSTVDVTNGVPGVPNVVHVLTNINVGLINLGTAQYAGLVYIAAPAIYGTDIVHLVCPPATNSVWGTEQWSWTGELTSQIGGALTVAVSAAGASSYVEITLETMGYDV